MTDRADVVVVGGGVQGAMVALHLLDAGVRDVRLIERDGMFEATSGAGAGFVAIWAAAVAALGPEEAAVERYGLAFYRDLQNNGHDIDFANNGLLYVATDDEATKYLDPGLASSVDPKTVAVDGTRVEQLTDGMVRAQDVRGALFQPDAVQVFAPKLGAVLAARIAQLGGVVDTRRPVHALRVNAGRVGGVETSRGVVECDNVVLAAGAWTNELLRPLGVYVPSIPLLTSRLISQPLGVPDTMPLLLFLRSPRELSALWVRGHEGAILFGGNYHTAPHSALLGLEKLPTRFDEVALDGVFMCRDVAADMARLMPTLADCTSVRPRHGAPCATPDQRALVGAVPGIEGLYAMAGDNEQGITHGPGFGKALADHIIHGSSDLVGLHAWRLDRFGDQFTNDASVAEALRVPLAGVATA